MVLGRRRRGPKVGYDKGEEMISPAVPCAWGTGVLRIVRTAEGRQHDAPAAHRVRENAVRCRHHGRLARVCVKSLEYWGVTLGVPSGARRRGNSAQALVAIDGDAHVLLAKQVADDPLLDLVRRSSAGYACDVALPEAEFRRLLDWLTRKM